MIYEKIEVHLTPSHPFCVRNQRLQSKKKAAATAQVTSLVEENSFQPYGLSEAPRNHSDLAKMEAKRLRLLWYYSGKVFDEIYFWLPL